MAKLCPVCKETNKDDEIRCTACGNDFPVPRPLTLDEVIDSPDYAHMKDLVAAVIGVVCLMLYLV